MPMYNILEYSDSYSKSPGILWQYCRDEPAINDSNIAGFNAANATTNSFKIKDKTTGEIGKAKRAKWHKRC